MNRPDDLPKRARLALILIYDWMQRPENVLENPPAHSELLELINAALPPRLSPITHRITPVFSSKEQTSRLAEQLRAAGLLVSAPGMQFNMKPTESGKAYVRRWRPEVEAWVAQEHNQWAVQGKNEATRKLRQRSAELVA